VSSNENYRRHNCQAFANISGNFQKISGKFSTLAQTHSCHHNAV